MLEVKGERMLLIPKIDDVVIEISLDDKTVKIRPLEGLL